MHEEEKETEKIENKQTDNDKNPMDIQNTKERTRDWVTNTFGKKAEYKEQAEGSIGEKAEVLKDITSPKEDKVVQQNLSERRSVKKVSGSRPTKR